MLRSHSKSSTFLTLSLILMALLVLPGATAQAQPSNNGGFVATEPKVSISSVKLISADVSQSRIKVEWAVESQPKSAITKFEVKLLVTSANGSTQERIGLLDGSVRFTELQTTIAKPKEYTVTLITHFNTDSGKAQTKTVTKTGFFAFDPS